MSAPIAEGIYITLGAKQIKEHGYKKYLDDFNRVNRENGAWYYQMRNLPKREFQYVYLVIGNQVRWRATLMGIEKDHYVEYWSGEVDEHFRGIVLADFVQIPAAHREHRKGCQGFRYKEF